MFAFANFNNMCNTWGQNVIEATKDECYLSCMGLVFSFFHRNFVPCYACETKTGDERIHAQLTKGIDGLRRLYVVNHSGTPIGIRLPDGMWALSEAIACKYRSTVIRGRTGDVSSCVVEIQKFTAIIPPLSVACMREC
jgi:hypothetical protein